MFPGGSYRVSTPRSAKKQKPPSKPSKRGKVWGNDIDRLEWISATGAPVSVAQVDPPDPDVTGGTRAIFPGGSDGLHHYLLAIDDAGDGQLWVDKFDKTCTSLLDRFEVTGVTNSPVYPKYTGSFSPEQQYVSASATRVVAVVDQWDESITDPDTLNDEHRIVVTVFDTAGTQLAQHQVYSSFSDGMGSWDDGTVESGSGSFCDGHNVYFCHQGLDLDGVTFAAVIAKVDLTTGVLTDLFALDDINALSPGGTWINYQGGIVAVDDTGSGDLILVGDDIARIRQDGTPVWFTANPNPGDVAFYNSCARSGRQSVWAAGPGEGYGGESPIAHEFGFNGTYRRASAFYPEPVYKTWLGPT